MPSSLRFSRPLMAACALLTLGACVTPQLPDLSGVTALIAPTPPVMRWDHREEAGEWTSATLAAIETHDDKLALVVPGDYETWCPGYPDADLAERRAFWAGLLSATAKHESTWNPEAVGGGGRYIGLMQISPRTARGYDCAAQDEAALKNGAANLVCAVEIMAVQVGRDGMVAGGGNRGIGRDWGPFKSDSKRAEMSEWTRTQSYCQ